MNNRCNNLLSAILGSFWDTLSGASHIVAWVKESHYRLTRGINNIAKLVSATVRIQETQYVLDTTTVYEPVASCKLSIGRILDYPMNGYIQKSLDIKTILIRRKSSDNIKVLVSGDLVFIPGINMKIDDRYLELYLPNAEDVTTDTVFDGDSLIYTYKLSETKKSNTSHTSNHSCILETGLNHMPINMARILWESSISGMSRAHVSSLLSYTINNECADASGMVIDVWREHSYYYVATSYGKVHRGVGIPLVIRGSSVEAGTSLFGGLRQFDKSRLPHAMYIPSIHITTADGPAEAINEEMPLIDTGRDYIPDISNNAWCTRMCADTSRGIMIPKTLGIHAINPAHYTITNLLPASFVLYCIDANKDIDWKSLDTVLESVMRTFPASGSCCVYMQGSRKAGVTTSVCIVQPTCSVSVSCNVVTPSVSINNVSVCII